MNPDAPRKDIAVLVVEDEILVRMTAVALAENCGFAVHDAADAEQAISTLESCPDIRIVLTDIQMGGRMNGLELAAYAHHRWPMLKFVIASGGLAPAPHEIPAGSRFFAKPYDPAAMSRALCELA